MTDSFLENCGGWTPAPDVLTRNKIYGFEGAYLWGRIRRLCQMGKGSFTISHEELGNRIGMSRRTVIKYLDRLIEDSYVEDLTPGVRNKAHTYSVKKGEVKILSGMQISHTKDDVSTENYKDLGPESHLGMRNLHSQDAKSAHPDLPTMQDLPTTYAKSAHPGMQNLHLKRDSLDTLKETGKKNNLDSSSCVGIWPQVEAILEMRMTRASYNAVMRGTSLTQENGHYVVTAPTEAAKELLENRFVDQVTFAVSSVTGAPAKIQFRLQERTNQ